MKSDISRYLTISLGLLLCVVIFLADLALPLGVGIGYFYLALVALVAWLVDRRWALVLAGLATLLLAVGLQLSRPGFTAGIAAANRVVAIGLMWSAAFLVSDRRRLLSQVTGQADALAAANAQLELQAAELNTTNRQLEQRSRELAAANELLQNQAEELEVQAEELQAQNDELQALTDTLEERVEQRTAELRRANQSLQAMPGLLIAVQENERRAISRELHDESGQLLTTLAIRLGLLRDLWQQGESLAQPIDELKQLASQLADGLHRVAVNLRPASLDRAGLVPAVEQYIRTYRQTNGLQVELVVNGMDGERLAPELESTLYRIVQEALTNVARHAKASRVGVMLNQRSDAVALTIEDDGIGFDAEAALRAGRLGLAGIKERTELRGGTLTIESQPGAGTALIIEIPCPSPLPLAPARARPETP